VKARATYSRAARVSIEKISFEAEELILLDLTPGLAFGVLESGRAG
jgi:hypothetical protein